MKGLIKWFYDLIIDIMDWAGNELLKVMNMDLNYFEETAPIIKTMMTIIMAAGWALLLGNLIYQAIRTMLHGAGFESEDPKILACRTMVFAFLLIVSREICNIGLSISGQIIDWLQFPNELGLAIPAEDAYDVTSSARWLIAIIVGIVLIFQIIKLLFEIGERYVVAAILTYFAPLAFGMGGSKNTQDIFRAWCRMYCSMLIMMIMSTVFLKLIISAMERAGDGNILVWLIFVVALARVARKLDSHIAKIGLNPAITGDGLGSRIPGMLTAVAVRSMASTIRHNGQMGHMPVAPLGGGPPGGSRFGGARPTAGGTRPASGNTSVTNFSSGQQKSADSRTTTASQKSGGSAAANMEYGAHAGIKSENNASVSSRQTSAAGSGRISQKLNQQKPVSGLQTAERRDRSNGSPSNMPSIDGKGSPEQNLREAVPPMRTAAPPLIAGTVQPPARMSGGVSGQKVSGTAGQGSNAGGGNNGGAELRPVSPVPEARQNERQILQTHTQEKPGVKPANQAYQIPQKPAEQTARPRLDPSAVNKKGGAYKNPGTGKRGR